MNISPEEARMILKAINSDSPSFTEDEAFALYAIIARLSDYVEPSSPVMAGVTEPDF